jgi:tetratricopeptide (TPR) repeat protein
VADSPRIEELRRRVDKDPASIAFAHLAEEYRRGGDLKEAVRVCRAGLVQHPNYVSARVTLARSLMELGQLDDAQVEFEQVLLVAPDNLVAVRSMAELYQLRGDTPPDLPPAPAPVAEPPPLLLADIPPLPELDLPLNVEETPEPIHAAAEPATTLDLDAAIAAFHAAFGDQPAAAPPPPPPPAADPVVSELESWLANIVADREERDRNS